MRSRFIVFFLAPILLVLAAFAIAALFSSAARAAEVAEALPLPRFAALRAEEVNLRAGPGESYPVKWVYRQRDLPVEITAEFKAWRKVRDWEGAEGWVHSSLLTGRRTGLISGGQQVLRARPVAEADPIARIDAGVVVRLIRCPRGNTFCWIETSGVQGWLDRRVFWGVYPGEYFD